MSEKLSVKYDEAIILATKESGGSGYNDGLIKRINGQCGDDFIIPKECNWVASQAFNSAGLTGTITIPSNCNYIGALSFGNNASLNTVIIENGVHQIGAQAFLNCFALTVIHIPVSCSLINQDAFMNTGLTDIYYKGTEEEWNNIRGINTARIPDNCTIHFNSVA